MFRRNLVLGLLVSCAYAIFGCAVHAQGDASAYGRVFDTGYGLKVQGATVTLRDGRLELSGVSQPDGRYSIERIPPGHYLVTVTCPGFATYHSDVTLSAGRSEINIPVELGLQDFGPVLIEGIVTDSKSNPLGGAVVVLSSPFDKTVTHRIPTKPNGRFSIDVLRCGQYVVYASKEGYKAVAKTVVVETERAEANFALPPFHR